MKMKKSKCVFSVLLALLLSVNLTIPAFAAGLDLTDNPDLAENPPYGTPDWERKYGESAKNKRPGKTYTVTATTATGITKTFTLDTTDMEDHVESRNSQGFRTDGSRIDTFDMAYSHPTYITERDPLLDTQCIIVPDGTKNLGTVGADGYLGFIVIPKSVKFFASISTETNSDYIILYEGTEAEWNSIEHRTDRQDLIGNITNATTLFNCDYYAIAAGKPGSAPAASASTTNKPAVSTSAAAKPAASASANFTDVKSSDYFAAPVQWAVGQGITGGVTATEFKPENNCTQAQAIMFLWRSQGCPTPSSAAPFNISPDKYYYTAMNWAYEKGLIDDCFRPNIGCTRATALKCLYKLAGSPAVDRKEFRYSGKAYVDVGEVDSCYDALAWAVDAGLIEGVFENHWSPFSPCRSCTRGQIVTLMYRAMVGQG